MHFLHELKFMNELNLQDARHHSSNVTHYLYEAIKDICDCKSQISYGASVKLNEALAASYKLNDLLKKTFPNDSVSLPMDHVS